MEVAGILTLINGVASLLAGLTGAAQTAAKGDALTDADRAAIDAASAALARQQDALVALHTSTARATPAAPTDAGRRTRGDFGMNDRPRRRAGDGLDARTDDLTGEDLANGGAPGA